MKRLTDVGHKSVSGVDVMAKKKAAKPKNRIEVKRYAIDAGHYDWDVFVYLGEHVLKLQPCMLDGCGHTSLPRLRKAARSMGRLLGLRWATVRED